MPLYVRRLTSAQRNLTRLWSPELNLPSGSPFASTAREKTV